MIDRSQFHATTILVTYKDIFDSELGIIQQYIIEVADAFESKAREMDYHFSLASEEDYRDRLETEYFKNALDFPKILNASNLISLQTLLEKTLQFLIRKCNLIFHSQKTKKKIPGESDIAFYCRVLTADYEIDCLTDSLIYSRLHEYRLLRNLFVHSGGNLSAEREEVKRLRILEIIDRSNDNLIIDQQTKQIIIYSNQYLIRFSQAIQAFLTPIFDQLIDKHTALIIEDSKTKKI